MPSDKALNRTSPFLNTSIFIRNPFLLTIRYSFYHRKKTGACGTGQLICLR